MHPIAEATTAATASPISQPRATLLLVDKHEDDPMRLSDAVCHLFYAIWTLVISDPSTLDAPHPAVPGRANREVARLGGDALLSWAHRMSAKDPDATHLVYLDHHVTTHTISHHPNTDQRWRRAEYKAAQLRIAHPGHKWGCVCCGGDIDSTDPEHYACTMAVCDPAQPDRGAVKFMVAYHNPKCTELAGNGMQMIFGKFACDLVDQLPT